MDEKDVQLSIDIIREKETEPLTEESVRRMLALALRTGYAMGTQAKPKASMTFRKK